MRSRLLPLAVIFALAAPSVAAADESAPTKKGPQATATELPKARASSDPGADQARPRRPRNVGLAIAGGIFAAIGAGGALTGLVMMNTSTGDCTAGSVCRQDAARVALFTGAPVMAAGLVMTILGMQPGDEVAEARIRPTIGLGPAAATLTWRF